MYAALVKGSLIFFSPSDCKYHQNGSPSLCVYLAAVPCFLFFLHSFVWLCEFLCRWIQWKSTHTKKLVLKLCSLVFFSAEREGEIQRLQMLRVPSAVIRGSLRESVSLCLHLASGCDWSVGVKGYNLSFSSLSWSPESCPSPSHPSTSLVQVNKKSC